MIPTSRSRFRVAVIGCGAVTRNSLLPVLAGHDHISVVALVDRDVNRARELAEAYGVRRVESDVAAITRADADGIVLATPPAHHAPAAIHLAGLGFHVFVEKPMAITIDDAVAIVESADRAGVALAVGLYRRLLPVSRLLRGVIEQGLLGRPLAVDIEEGGEYSWQLATLSVLTREGGGGGVLIDLGTHLIDQLLFVLPGPVRLIEYADNARGGIETDCEIQLEIESQWGPVPARIELSRTRQLRGTIRVTCERGTFELVRSNFTHVRVMAATAEAPDAVAGQSRSFEMSAHWSAEKELVGYKAFRAEFDDWLNAIQLRTEPQLSGRSVVPVVRLVEECYRRANALPEPWTDGGLDLHAIQLSPSTAAPFLNLGRKPRVLVTGAGGFLGCRSVEILHQSGDWDIRAAVRRPGSAARLARLPIEVVLADVGSADDMQQAVSGCDAVVHCAVGTGWPPEVAFRTTVDGTRTVAAAALNERVRRFVHISSMAVHGDAVPVRLDESAPLDPGTGVGYSRAKYLAEQAINDAVRRGLPAISLRPARIYGPFSRTFTVRPLQALREGRLVLAGDADTPSNMVFVDNVVEAIVRALCAPASENGEAFLISEPDQLSWREFYEFFAQGTDTRLRVAARSGESNRRQPGLARRWMSGLRAIALSPELRGLAKKILWTDPIGTGPRRLWERSPAFQKRVQKALGIDAAVIYREPPPPTPDLVQFRIDPTLVVFEKASTRLGYVGAIPRDAALVLTRNWARAARLI